MQELRFDVDVLVRELNKVQLFETHLFSSSISPSRIADLSAQSETAQEQLKQVLSYSCM